MEALRKAEAAAVQRVRRLEEERKNGDEKIEGLEKMVGKLKGELEELEGKRKELWEAKRDSSRRSGRSRSPVGGPGDTILILLDDSL